jgi:uncharacterized membrane protein YoaK (UPF0700 family)
MISITLILLVTALIATLWHAINGQVPLWVPLLLVIIALLLNYLPLK